MTLDAATETACALDSAKFAFNVNGLAPELIETAPVAALPKGALSSTPPPVPVLVRLIVPPLTIVVDPLMVKVPAVVAKLRVGGVVWPLMVEKFAVKLVLLLTGPVLVTQTLPNWLLTTTLPPSTLMGMAAVPILSAPVVDCSIASSSSVPVAPTWITLVAAAIVMLPD